MTPDEETMLSDQLTAVLNGSDPLSVSWPKDTYGYRLLRWEADVPLTEDERSLLTEAVTPSMRIAGAAGCRLSEEGDELTVLLCPTHFPAKTHRETVLWLCARALMEAISMKFEQEGTMLIGEEFASPIFWHEALQPMREIVDWWSSVCPIPAAEAFRHRANLQTLIKRRQYGSLGGYITRALRGVTEVSQFCFGFVPIVIEAVWNQHAELSLEKLTEELNLSEMTRKPREALLSWTDSLQPRLKACPAASAAAPIERVIAGIRTDCSLPYSQANLSRSLGLTPAYFCRLFHEKTGQHFSAFLTMVRMEKAQELLAGPDALSLQEISQACGYLNKSYFCQVFKKYTGMTPGEFEEEQKTRRG